VHLFQNSQEMEFQMVSPTEEIADVWGDGHANYLDMIIVFYIVPHKYVELLCVLLNIKMQLPYDKHFFIYLLVMYRSPFEACPFRSMVLFWNLSYLVFLPSRSWSCKNILDMNWASCQMHSLPILSPIL
jgi:hypothetical protein